MLVSHTFLRFAYRGTTSGCLEQAGGSFVAGSLMVVAPVVWFRVCSVLCCTLLCVLSSFAIIWVGKRKLVAFLCLYS